MKSRCAIATVALSVVLALTGFARAEAPKGWGTIKGHVVFNGPAPAPVEIAKAGMDAGCKACAIMGKTFDDELVVDSKTNGVRWAMVWLLHPSGDFKKAIPIHPSLVKAEPSVVLDQPCCGVRAAQSVPPHGSDVGRKELGQVHP